MSEKKKEKGPDYYEVLGVPKDSTLEVIKKAYRKGALENHPDRKPGDKEAEERFKLLSHAYEILADPEKRKIYDKYGDEGLQGGGFHSASDIFSQFFSGDEGFSFGNLFGFGGGGGRREAGPRRTRDIQYKLGVSLKDFYCGREKKLKITREVVCDLCFGSGTKEGSAKGEVSCAECKGRGMVTEISQIRPGFISQSSRPCHKCGGVGKSISKEDRCSRCEGKKVMEKEKEITVNIDKGMQPGEKAVFYGESNEAPGAQTGDLYVFLLSKQEEEGFPWERKGHDLIYKKKLSLVEALTGYEFHIKHFDDRILKVTSLPNDVIKPNDIRVIEKEGMPVYKDIFNKGNIFIVFEVVFPTYKQLKPKIKELKTLLPKPDDKEEKKLAESKNVEKVVAKTYNPAEYGRQQQQYNRHSGSGGATRESDSEEEGGGGCYQQ